MSNFDELPCNYNAAEARSDAHEPEFETNTIAEVSVGDFSIGMDETIDERGKLKERLYISRHRLPSGKIDKELYKEPTEMVEFVAEVTGFKLDHHSVVSELFKLASLFYAVRRGEKTAAKDSGLFPSADFGFMKVRKEEV